MLSGSHLSSREHSLFLYDVTSSVILSHLCNNSSTIFIIKLGGHLAYEAPRIFKYASLIFLRYWNLVKRAPCSCFTIKREWRTSALGIICDYFNDFKQVVLAFESYMVRGISLLPATFLIGQSASSYPRDLHCQVCSLTSNKI